MKTSRRCLTNPDDWWEAFERQALVENKPLSLWAADCMRKCLPVDVAESLSERVQQKARLRELKV